MKTPNVKTGLMRLLGESERLGALKGRRVGLLVNPTSVTADLTHAIDALLAAGVRVERLFGPEHGVRAEAQDMEAVDETTDPITGLPTISLYGHVEESLTPKPHHLDGLDVVIADVQDIGARYYTYAYTVGLMMGACGRAGIPCVVLDRPNPIAGLRVEGNTVRPECGSFVGMQPLATQHGMTLGELARFFNSYTDWRCELEVVTLDGWRRDQWFDQTGLPWVMPSPNMPTLDTATVYPGQCLIEGTNLSEARGTTRPFELFGAPYVDAARLAARMGQLGHEGALLRQVSFRPMFQKHARTTCAGLQVHVTDRDAFSSLRFSMCLISACLELFPDDFGWRDEAYEFVADLPAIDLLLGDTSWREALEAGAHPDELLAAAEASDSRAEFNARRAASLLY